MSESIPAKVLFYDIESTNLAANFGYLLCVGYKYLGDKRVFVPSLLDYPDAFGRDPTSDKRLMQDIWKVMAEADLWVGYYSKRFDLPMLNARMLNAGLDPLPPIPHLDLYDTVKQNLRLHRRRLGTVGEFLGLKTDKTPLAGSIWVRAAAGHKPSIRYVVEHCRHDVKLLEEAYLKLRPFIRLHPNITGTFGSRVKGKCRTCGSGHLQWRGRMLLTRSNAKRRIRCSDCGSWDTRLA